MNPFLPAPPAQCACGVPLEMEMEHDKGICVQCQHDIETGVWPRRLEPLFAGLVQPFITNGRTA